jgi:hypothetical protein
MARGVDLMINSISSMRTGLDCDLLDERLGKQRKKALTTLGSTSYKLKNRKG